MTELVLLANNADIKADSVAYYANGAVVKTNMSYTSTTFADISYTTTTFANIDYATLVYFLSSSLSAGEYFLTSDSDKFLVQSTQQHYDIRY